ncbi:uncharacterized protein BROUX77_003953 [Berkeleyomyces rouxiae]|uniref:uncharacterized protein n=1 Tax=Berkeleyomyces rouxiae TaxID=2035830 RepID=UPI003B7D3C3F
MRLSLFGILASAALIRAGCFEKVCSDYSFDLSSTDNTNWMSQIGDNVDLSDLSIPGTRHSTTSLLWDDRFQCQNTNLKQQLYSGIRYIDVTARQNNDKIEIYYRGFDTTYSLDSVLTIVFDFLEKYPRETVLVRIRKDTLYSGDDGAFETIMARYLNSDTELGRRAQALIYKRVLPSPFWRAPTLGLVRGRLVLLQDFPTKEIGRFGLPWGTTAVVESDWNWATGSVGMFLKWTFVKHGMKSALKEKERRLHFINTGVSIGVDPYKAAGGRKPNRKGINDLLGDHFSEPNVARAGIIAMDFPGSKLVHNIIESNKNLRVAH